LASRSRQFGEGWDLPPGVGDVDWQGNCEAQSEDDQLLDARCEGAGDGDEAIEQYPMLGADDEDDCLDSPGGE
jgi:hypothetical protein